MAENNNQLMVKSISELSGMDFIIMDYQRGYRWTKVEVKELLEDLLAFAKRQDKSKGEFYCLQPVVVRDRETHYEVIDGQQRLTTLYLILTCLKQPISFIYPGFKLFEIDYRTRIGSKEFLKKIDNPEGASQDYIDYYFMTEAYETIKEWFKPDNLSDTLRNDIINALLSHNIVKENVNGEEKDVDVANNVRVIWYEISKDEEATSVDIFTRLNVGKIPLTDSELVKALFLNSNNFKGNDQELAKVQLSNEWNEIEQNLQNDSFWYFLKRSSNTLEYPNRIEFIFDIISGRNLNSSKNFTFHKFQELVEKDGVDKTWDKIKSIYLILREWYEDRELYHLLGYLFEESNIKINDVIQNWEDLSKSDFKKRWLKRKVEETIKDLDYTNLQYKENNAGIKKVLLLFNILTSLLKENSLTRFSFDKFKKEQWDIEHVCSQTDKQLESKDVLPWVKDIIMYYFRTVDLPDIKTRIKELGYDNDLGQELIQIYGLYNSGDKDLVKARELFDKMQARFKESDASIKNRDNIGNLTLLDAKTNRSYRNAFYPIKRMKIVENDESGIFIPIATKNMFLKFYSNQVANMIEWTEQDRIDYLEKLSEVIDNYINNNSDGTE